METLPINEKDVLSQQCLDVRFGLPYSKAPLTSTGGTGAKSFILPPELIPIYPVGNDNIAPTVDDVTAYLKTGTVYTETEITSIDPITSTITGKQVNGGVTLTTAPTTGETVWLDGVQGMRPVVTQSLDQKPKQDTKEYGEMGSTLVTESFGSISNSLKFSVVNSVDTIIQQAQLLYNLSDTDSETNPFISMDMNDKPIGMYAEVLVMNPVDLTDLIAVYKYDKCYLKPDNPGGKDGGAGTMDYEFIVPSKPKLLVKPGIGLDYLRDLGIGA